MGDSNLLALASEAGRYLITRGVAEQGGIKWAPSDSWGQYMPNFSHGTAGVSYFLATLYQKTGDKRFLEASLAGAKYLLAVADTEGNSCKIFHHEPGGKDLYYYGWCHGPPGTVRLFLRLYEVTQQEVWKQWMLKAANAVMASGIPAKQLPGFWNNVSLCCGTASVALFNLEMYRLTGDKKYWNFARVMADDLVRRATPVADGGYKWIQAENRVSPNQLIAQTGLMQGAAGIGIVLLEMDAAEHGTKLHLELPDDPFVGSGK
ncbi:MAG: lanthionine synthetase LanC family protein [Bryobacteraceae bacterium]